MKLISSNIFGQIRKPKNFDELFQSLIEYENSSSNCQARMWRGQGNIEWPIHSSGYRRIKQKDESSLADYEVRLIEQATHSGYRSHEGRQLSDMELLARLQHHGAATRLLDTSRSVLVALYFCCVSNPKKMGLLIGVHTDHLAGCESEPDARKYEEVMDDIKDTDTLFTWEPPVITNRIAAQHSQFLFSKLKENSWGSLVLPREEGATNFYAISPSLKEESLEILQEVFDIRQFTLFPDIDGFCQANSYAKDEYFTYRW